MKMEAEKKNCERRDKVRWAEISQIAITENKAEIKHDARMFNYSKNGIYFESDSLIEAEKEIYIAIQNTPSDLDVSDYNCLSAKVAWRKELGEDAYFYYGYGAYFTSNNTDAINCKDDKNKRRHTRSSISKSIVFSNQGKVYKGEASNISPTGVFIKSEKLINPDDEIAFLIPKTKKDSVIFRGKVVWSNQEGFGLKFVSKRHVKE